MSETAKTSNTEKPEQKKMILGVFKIENLKKKIKKLIETNPEHKEILEKVEKLIIEESEELGLSMEDIKELIVFKTSMEEIVEDFKKLGEIINSDEEDEEAWEDWALEED